ncbi:MAG: hypothetical protein R2792_09210 [Saprospiraceae bacterium]
MARNAEGLKSAIQEIRALREEFWKDVFVPGTTNEFNPELEKAWRVADFMELGELMCIDALHRNESCGGHFRRGIPNRRNDDKNFMYVATWEFQGEGAEPALLQGASRVRSSESYTARNISKQTMPFLKHILLPDGCSQYKITIANPAMAQEVNQCLLMTHLREAGCCQTPKGWIDCGDKNETEPDIQPGLFEVTTEPYDGNTYLGMVVRDNDTKESIGQELWIPLFKDSTYQFRVILAQSDKYLSLSKKTREGTNYNTPVILKVYGGGDQNEQCLSEELLLTTPYIDHTYWKEYTFIFQPKQTHQYIKLEVDWAPQFRDLDMDTYNGNLLLDNCSLTKIN